MGQPEKQPNPENICTKVFVQQSHATRKWGNVKDIGEIKSLARTGSVSLAGTQDLQLQL